MTSITKRIETRTKHTGWRYRNGTSLLLSFFSRNSRTIFSATIFLIFDAIIKLLPAVVIGMALDILVEEGYGIDFLRLISLIVVLALANYVMRFLGNYIYAVASMAFERDIRQDYIDTIISRPLRFHDQQNSSHLLALGMNEIRWIQHGIMPGMTMVLRAILSVLFVVVYLYSLVDIYILLIVIIGFTGYFYLGYHYAAKVGPIRTQISEHLSLLTEQSQETFKGIELIRSFGAVDRETSRFNQYSTKFAQTQREEIRQSTFFFPSLLFLLIIAIVFTLALIDVQDNVISVGELIQILGLLLTLQAVNLQLPRHLLNFRAALVNSARLCEKMGEHPLLLSPSTGTSEADWTTDLVFDQVSLSYTVEQPPVLDDISFTLPYGSKVAIVGGPGSGKSSLLKLLLNLYQPQEGVIRIGESSYAELDDREIRRHVALVEQEVFLFSGTIKENITFSRSDVSEEELLRITKAAQAWEFIQKLPQGFETIIGERGVTLSGGQRQRVAIARALLANPDILLLDDSSSALDSQTDHLLRNSLENLGQDRTTIMVTQGLASLVSADQIIVMAKGHIEAIGDHDELLSTNKRYRQIFSYLPDHQELIGGLS